MASTPLRTRVSVPPFGVFSHSCSCAEEGLRVKSRLGGWLSDVATTNPTTNVVVENTVILAGDQAPNPPNKASATDRPVGTASSEAGHGVKLHSYRSMKRGSIMSFPSRIPHEFDDQLVQWSTEGKSARV